MALILFIHSHLLRLKGASSAYQIRQRKYSMQKVTLLFLTIIFTSVIVQFSSGRITVAMHGTRIRAPPTRRRQNPATEKEGQQRVQDSNNSNTSKNAQRPHHTRRKEKSKVSINTPHVCNLVSGGPNEYHFSSISGLIVLKEN